MGTSFFDFVERVQIMLKKNINIELIRIIAMIAVVGHHYFRHGGGIEWAAFGTREYVIFWIVDAFLFVCVNLFVLISGYCLVNAPFKLSRFINLWVMVVTYSLFCTLIYHYSENEVSTMSFIKAFIPFTTQAYWFMTAYSVMLFCSPFLNMAIHSMSKIQHQLTVLGIIFIFSIVPTFFVWARDLITTGMDYQWFIALYIIGAYIKKYGLKFSTKQALAGYILSSLITGGLRIPLGTLSIKLINSDVLAGLFFRYNSVTVLAASVFLFWWGLRIEIQSENIKGIINSISPLTLAVYLIHDNSLMRKLLWDRILPMQILFRNGAAAYLCGFFIIVPCIFFGCCFIEKIRQIAMRKIHWKSFLRTIDLKANDILNDWLLKGTLKINDRHV